jgi:hypothetical protein
MMNLKSTKKEAVTESIKQKTTTIKNIWNNLFELVEASSIATISIYAMWAAKYHYGLKTHFDYLLLSAGVVVAFMGFTLLVKHLNRK